MNPKFFDVKKEKQDAIINAALMVFAENGYKKASTDNIVKAAGISKGLLFHYFISKQGVYEFIYDYSIKYTTLELSQTINRKETDFFAIQRMIELTKLRVMKNYPYMQQFLNNVKYETHPDALKIIQESENSVDEAYAEIYKRADMSRFNRPVDAQKIIRMIGWMSDGFIRDKFRNGTPEPDSMNGEFAQYLSMLREHFYGNDYGNSDLVIEATEAVRYDSVMDSMRNEMSGEPVKAVSTSILAAEEVKEKPATKSPAVTVSMQPEMRELSFEERLALGKKSAYYQEPEANKDAGSAGATEPSGVTIESITPVDELKPSYNADTEKSIDAAEITEATEQEIPRENKEAPKSEEPSTDGEAVKNEGSEAVEEAAKSEEQENDEKSVKTAASNKEDKAVDRMDGPASQTEMVVSCLPEMDISFFEISRLGDFSYGSDERGGRGIPYDSSGNVQIFVEDDEDDEDDEDYDEDTVDNEAANPDAVSKESQAYVSAPAEGEHEERAEMKIGDAPDTEREAESKEAVASDEKTILKETDDDKKDDGSAEASGAKEESTEPDEKTADNTAKAAHKDDLDIDLDGLSEKIMSHTDKESEERERIKELESMGPAPILPDFNPENISSGKASVDEENEDVHIYRPLSF